MKQIIAMGAGYENNGEAQSKIEKYLFAATGKPNPKVSFLPTARWDEAKFIEDMLQRLKRLNCQPSIVQLLRPDISDPAALLLGQDLIYVGGGNTKNMLALWRDWGVDEAIKHAYQNGTVLAGWSAGAICWFEGGVTDSIPGELSAMDCLGYLEGSCCPHYDSEGERQPSYHRLVSGNHLGPGYAIDDGAALHFHDGRLARSVNWVEGARAYRVEKSGEEIIESGLEMEALI